MRIRRQTLLEQLEVIDTALLSGTTTNAQERRGQKIVTLVNSAQKLVNALKMAENQLSKCCRSEDGRDRSARRALKISRVAIANATRARP